MRYNIRADNRRVGSSVSPTSIVFVGYKCYLSSFTRFEEEHRLFKEEFSMTVLVFNAQSLT